MATIRYSILLLSLFTATRLPAAEIIPAVQPVARKGSPAAEAAEAYREGRRNAARELARPLAGQGDADALFLLAFSLESLREPARLSRAQAMDYYYRRAEAARHPEAALRRKLISLASGREMERSEALAFLETAAKEGNATAFRILGEARLRGLTDGKPDPAKAAEDWKAAAGAGDTPSLLLLGHLYAGVFGFPEAKDPEAAADYYRQAAAKDGKNALLPLASLLLAGSESARDPEEGLQIAADALRAGDTAAWLILGDHHAAGKNMQAAIEAYRQGAAAGRHECMLRLARWYSGEGKEPEEGNRWLGRAAAAGNPEAAAELGRRMLAGAPAEAAAGIPHLLLAAAEGLPGAQHDLALAYLEGKGCPKDTCAAVAWLTEAMKSGDAAIQYRLGTLHEQGIGTPVNYANAGVLYTMASGKGHAGAAARIAFMASEGLGTARNPAQAHAYAALALERGETSVNDLFVRLDRELGEPGKTEAGKILAGLKAGTAQSPKSGTKPAAPDKP